MSWDLWIKSYKIYLSIERALSENSIQAYLRDINKLKVFFSEEDQKKSPETITTEDINLFLTAQFNQGLNASSQARLVSGLKSFFYFLLLEKVIEESPMEHIEQPIITKKIPDVLSIQEIEKIIASIDLSQKEGQRNRAIIEMLYGCGLRVSELIAVKISNIHTDEGFILIRGKGRKERLVPFSGEAKKHVWLYMEHDRSKMKIHSEYEDLLFLNRRGKPLTRNMIFIIVKKLAELAGIQKKVSPHTFRHSFATHMIENGADLRVVQEMLGHESITTTEIYTHIDRQYLRSNILKYHPRSQHR